MNVDKLLTNRFLRFSIPAALVIIFWFFFKDKFSNIKSEANKMNCTMKEQIKNQSIKGLIFLKYNDQRKLRRFKYVSGFDSIDSDIFVLEMSDSYKYLSVGDSVIKEMKSLEFKVVREGKDTIFVLSYLCKE